MRDVAVIAWRVAVLGSLVVVAGFGAIVAATVLGMALISSASIVDGYDRGLLPWMEVGTWLVPIGGLVATVGGLAAIWLGRSGWLVRVATIPALVGVIFWVLLVVIKMAPRHGSVPNSPTTSSDLATVVYSSPANTIFFLLVPAFVIVLLAATSRRRTT
jgi:hypothetical protein